MSWALGESAAQAALSYFATNGAAKMTAVQGRFSDGVTLPNFVARRLADPNTAIEPEFPVCYAVPLRDVPEPGPGGLARGRWMFTGEVVFVVVYEAAVDLGGSGTTVGEVLAAMGMRYGVAVLEMLAASIASTGIQWGTATPIEVSYGPRYTLNERGTIGSDVQIRIGYQRQESSL